MYDLSSLEARVIGSLIEKALTTPDQYPLSLNSLTMACNQKTNREPVMELTEAQVQSTLDDLVKKHLVSPISAMGSRVVKYQHRFCNTQFSELQLSPGELAVACVLLLRGWQTPGELRTRTQRLHDFNDVLDVEKVLHHLMERSQPLVCRLEREPGKREHRYAHLFGSDIHEQAQTSAGGSHAGERKPDELTALREELAQLREEYVKLSERVSVLEGLF